MKHATVLFPVGVFVTIIIAASAIAYVGGFRLNLTPSEPLGLWRIEAIQRPVDIGDMVFVCPPITPVFEEARRRDYLRWGACAGGVAPLIKTVVALSGQRITIGDDVLIDGHHLPASHVQTFDGAGRPLSPYVGGIVPPGFLFLHSSFASSYDSQYFGPVPASGLLGFARPVFTFEP